MPSIIQSRFNSNATHQPIHQNSKLQLETLLKYQALFKQKIDLLLNCKIPLEIKKIHNGQRTPINQGAIKSISAPPIKSEKKFKTEPSSSGIDFLIDLKACPIEEENNSLLKTYVEYFNLKFKFIWNEFNSKKTVPLNTDFVKYLNELQLLQTDIQNFMQDEINEVSIKLYQNHSILKDSSYHPILQRLQARQTSTNIEFNHLKSLSTSIFELSQDILEKENFDESLKKQLSENKDTFDTIEQPITRNYSLNRKHKKFQQQVTSFIRRPHLYFGRGLEFWLKKKFRDYFPFANNLKQNDNELETYEILSTLYMWGGQKKINDLYSLIYKNSSWDEIKNSELRSYLQNEVFLNKLRELAINANALKAIDELNYLAYKLGSNFTIHTESLRIVPSAAIPNTQYSLIAQGKKFFFSSVIWFVAKVVSFAMAVTAFSLLAGFFGLTGPAAIIIIPLIIIASVFTFLATDNTYHQSLAAFFNSNKIEAKQSAWKKYVMWAALLASGITAVAFGTATFFAILSIPIFPAWFAAGIAIITVVGELALIYSAFHALIKENKLVELGVYLRKAYIDSWHFALAEKTLLNKSTAVIKYLIQAIGLPVFVVLTSGLLIFATAASFVTFKNHMTGGILLWLELAGKLTTATATIVTGIFSLHLLVQEIFNSEKFFNLSQSIRKGFSSISTLFSEIKQNPFYLYHFIDAFKKLFSVSQIVVAAGTSAALMQHGTPFPIQPDGLNRFLGIVSTGVKEFYTNISTVEDEYKTKSLFEEDNLEKNEAANCDDSLINCSKKEKEHLIAKDSSIPTITTSHKKHYSMGFFDEPKLVQDHSFTPTRVNIPCN